MRRLKRYETAFSEMEGTIYSLLQERAELLQEHQFSNINSVPSSSSIINQIP